jgi:hypothetical protein
MGDKFENTCQVGKYKLDLIGVLIRLYNRVKSVPIFL